MFKFRKFDLKHNFINNSNARKFLNYYALKWYEARRLTKLILYESPDPPPKTGDSLLMYF